MGDPSISETALGRDHYTRQGQLDQIVDVRGSDIRFMNLVLSVCALPRRSMGHQRQYVRRTGDYMLAFNATHPDYGLPLRRLPETAVRVDLRRSGANEAPRGWCSAET